MTLCGGAEQKGDHLMCPRDLNCDTAHMLIHRQPSHCGDYSIATLTLYTRMSPEITHKLIGFYMEVLILGTILQYMVSASLSCFL